MNISELAKFRGGVSVDTITELTSASGVTIDSMLIKDGKTSSNNIDWQEPTMFRNRIINGGMVIDQRATATSTLGAYSVDRWEIIRANDATESWAQSTGVAGFAKSLANTISVADATIGATQYSGIDQKIEGLNIADLMWGTSSAKPVTISFWVNSPTIGAYALALSNSGASRTCPIQYTINAANTWEYKTVTVAGCTDGTWLTTNGIGITLNFYLALGSSYVGGTSGVWNSIGLFGVAPVNGLAATGTFAITGVQLEPGTVATPFEFRPYGTELALCQRYYWKSQSAPNSNIQPTSYNGSGTNTIGLGAINFKTTMRISPDVTITGTWTTINCGQPAITGKSADGFHIYVISSAAGLVQAYNADAALQYIEAKAEL